jgi:hypothetical protein
MELNGHAAAASEPSECSAPQAETRIFSDGTQTISTGTGQIPTFVREEYIAEMLD